MRRPAQMDKANFVLDTLLRDLYSVPMQQPKYNSSALAYLISRINIAHRLTRLLAGGLLFFAAPAVEANAVGATAGNFAVSPSGTATYSIPLFVPPGTNGLQPKLSLNYSSQVGSGLLGIGWAIDGLSIIHRCGATIAIDGFKGGVNYNANDKFCLNGERLINIGGTEYRTQHESWKKIIAVGGTVSDPSYFVVTNRDGVIQYYGTTVDSRIEAQGMTIAKLWALNNIQDRNGNYLTITYQEDNPNGDFRPASIAYTGNGAVAPYNFLYFDYEARTDVSPTYEAGAVSKITQRLKTIRSCTNTICAANNGLARQYNLSYDNNGTMGRSRLTNIQECGSDGICLPSTNFTWTTPPSGLVGTSVNTGIGANPRSQVIRPADINGDGRDDLAWVDASNNYIYTALALSNTSGFNPAANSNIVTQSDFSLGDINGDGKHDLLTLSGTQIYYSLTTSAGIQPLVNSGLNIGQYGASPFLADFDGNGQADLMFPYGSYTQGIPTTLNYAFSTGTGFGSLSVSEVDPWYEWNILNIIPLDFKGEGRNDLLCVQTDLFNGRLFYALSFYTGSGFSECSVGISPSSASAGPWPADINGDGKSDVIWIRSNNIYYAFSTGTGFTPLINSYVTVAPVAANNITPADINSDGRADVVWMQNVGGASYIFYSLATGNGFAPAVNSGVSAPINSGPWAVDFSGDGKQDLVWLYNGTIYSSLSQGGASDLITSVTDGLGTQTNITYKSLTDSTVYTKDNTSVYPYQDVQSATYAVSQHTQSNGTGGVNTTTHQYGGLKAHHSAATGLGFRWMKSTDPAGLVHITYFNQALDGTEGTVAASETWAGNVRVKYAGNTWTPVSLGGGRTLARLTSSVEETRELDNSIVSTVNTSYMGYDAFGNPGSIAINFNDGWSKTTANTYNNDTVNWQLGQLWQSQVTAYAPGQSAQTRTSSFTYDTLGRLATEVIEPNSTTLRLTTAYGYDGFGNRSSKTVSGPDITTRTEYYDYTDGRGQFMMVTRNALTHPTSYTYDLRTGAVKTVKDPNNITTTFTYNDGFGRKTQESRPGSPTTDIYYLCWNGSVPASGTKCPTPTGPAITAVRTVTTGAGENYIYSDIFGRTVQTNTQGFGGNWIYKTAQYDSLGRVTSVSHPYFSGETVHYTTYDYYPDPLGRLWKVTESGPGNRTTTTAYNGLSTTVTTPPTVASPGGQVKTTVKNSQGLVASVTDNAGTTSYTYDPFGNLLRVAKSYDVGADIAMGYDIRGRKTSMIDPDMGSWTYGYNTLGELVWQKDAKLQTISMTYDVLGRMKTRALPFGEFAGTWTYDTAANGKGKLASSGDANATETYTYDTLSRVSSQTTSIGGVTYTTGYTYDAYSRLLTLTYPITGFKIYHVYDAYGYLTEVRKDSATGLRYWKADTFDAHGRLTQETFGNGLISQRAYSHETGDLNTIQTGTSTNPASVQNSSFIFDALDNLTGRSWWDGTAPRSETFGYDTLNRLTTVTGPANKTYSYYPNGNLWVKSDVGIYNYSATRPHAVASIGFGGTNTYSYDANGNMTSGNGRAITYYSFNKPKTVTKGSTTDTFTYDANFNRLIKSVNTIPAYSTIYIGKLYEKFSVGSVVYHKHYLYAGNNLVGYYDSTAAITRYFHTDHLGSVDTITNETGGVVQRLSYDAWGKRRNVNGTDATSITAQTTRGFTRHEHDDEVGLINMNAREYDPVLGRFISPDTLIPQATNSQAYNRFSYVLNNPLSRIDPTGQWSLKKAIRSITRSVSSIFRAEVHAVTSLASWQVNTAKRYVDWQVRSAEKAAHNPYVRTAAGIYAGFLAGPLAAGLFEGSVFGTSVAVGFTGGYVAGYTLTGDPRVAREAGITGGIFGGVSYYSQDWSAPGRITARAVTGGATAQLQGGDFRTGFLYEGASATASWGYQKFVGYMATPAPGQGVAVRGPNDPPPLMANTIGTQVPLTGSTWDFLFSVKEGSLLSNALNLIPGINAVSKFHDNIVIRNDLDTLMRDYVMNVPTMPIAAVITYGSLLDGPLSVQLAMDRSH